MKLSEIRAYETKLMKSNWFQALGAACCWGWFVAGSPWENKYVQFVWSFLWGLMAIYSISLLVAQLAIRFYIEDKIKQERIDGAIENDLKEFHKELHGVSGCSKPRSMRRRILICHRNYKMRR
jgi:hypothetical protein